MIQKMQYRVLSNELQKEFLGAKGYLTGNLWRMLWLEKCVLTNFTEVQTHEEYLLNRTNIDLTISMGGRVRAKLAVKLLLEY